MLYEQFSKPEGWMGKMVGWFMLKENDDLNEWTLSILDIMPEEKVLEIGFGPGSALKVAAEDKQAEVYGIDPSEAMVETAAKRLQRSAMKRQVCLIHGEARLLNSFHMPLDKIYSINNITFWDNPEETLKHLSSLLRRGGKIALTICPHEEDATDRTSERLGEWLTSLLTRAGFTKIEVKMKQTNPNDTVCVVATKM